MGIADVHKSQNNVLCGVVLCSSDKQYAAHLLLKVAENKKKDRLPHIPDMKPQYQLDQMHTRVRDEDASHVNTKMQWIASRYLRTLQ